MENNPGLVPLTETTLFILLSLVNGPRYGYAIIKDVEQLSAGRVQMSAGTLYGAIKRLVEQDLIERLDDVEDEEAPRPGLPRKHYRLTGAGRRLLNMEVARLESVMQAIRLRGQEGAA